MRAFKLFVACVLALSGISCDAATNAFQEAILCFPDITADQFRPDQAVRSANVLIRAGKASACAVLRQVAPKREWQRLVKVGEPDFRAQEMRSEAEGRDWRAQEDANKKACFLCRLLFTPRNAAEPLRPPGLGVPMLVTRKMKPQNWPYLPFAIEDDVPLSLTEGYTFEGGIPERGCDYLSYCLANGVFRTEPFPEPTPLTASNALVRVLTSSWWKAQKWNAPEPGVTWLHPLSDSEAGDLKTSAAETLWEQVRNMPNPQGGANGRQPFSSETNRTSAAAASRRSP
jgi:hypothetical protein